MPGHANHTHIRCKAFTPFTVRNIYFGIFEVNLKGFKRLHGIVYIEKAMQIFPYIYSSAKKNCTFVHIFTRGYSFIHNNNL